MLRIACVRCPDGRTGSGRQNRVHLRLRGATGSMGNRAPWYFMCDLVFYTPFRDGIDSQTGENRIHMLIRSAKRSTGAVSQYSGIILCSSRYTFPGLKLATGRTGSRTRAISKRPDVDRTYAGIFRGSMEMMKRHIFGTKVLDLEQGNRVYIRDRGGAVARSVARSDASPRKNPPLLGGG